MKEGERDERKRHTWSLRISQTSTYMGGFATPGKHCPSVLFAREGSCALMFTHSADVEGEEREREREGGRSRDISANIASGRDRDRGKDVSGNGIPDL